MRAELPLADCAPEGTMKTGFNKRELKSRIRDF